MQRLSLFYCRFIDSAQGLLLALPLVKRVYSNHLCSRNCSR